MCSTFLKLESEFLAALDYLDMPQVCRPTFVNHWRWKKPGFGNLMHLSLNSDFSDLLTEVTSMGLYLLLYKMGIIMSI